MKRSFLLLLGILLTFLSYSQQKIISGNVVSKALGTPLSGVSITSPSKSVTSDSIGNFSILTSIGESLTFSYVGMTSLKVEVKTLTTLKIELTEELANLNEVVVTGYQVQRKVDLTGAVSVVKTSDIANIPASNLITSLQGRVPGVFIEADGRPNGGQRRLLIRGLSTLGNTNPLFVIDGVSTLNQQAFQNIDPSLIESLQVLKDAAAGSIYGARASNGVIIVTTKQGKEKMQIKLNTSYGIDAFIDKLPVLDVFQRGQALWQAAINDKISPDRNASIYSFVSSVDANGVAKLDKVIPVPWIGGSESFMTPGANTDWQDVVFKNGKIKSTELNISVAGKHSTGLFGFSYLDNQGMMSFMQFQKYSGRVNTSFSFLNDKVKIGENLQISYTRNTPDRTDLGGSDLVNLSRFMQPILPVYRTDGAWSGPIGAGFSDRNNPYHMLSIYKNNVDKSMNLFGNIYAEAKPIKDLLIRSSIGIDYTDGYNFGMFPNFSTGFLSRTINSLRIDQSHRYNWIWSTTANYNKTFGLHNLNLLVGTEALKNDYITLGAIKEGFAIEDLNYYVLGAGTGNQTNSGDQTGNQLLSYFSKLNYNYSDKYILALTVRQDGASRFGLNNQYGIFPSISGGWRLNNESFFKKIDMLSNLKLRAGWGIVGNQEIGDESSYGVYATNYGALSGNRRNIGSAYDIYGVNGGTLLSGYTQVRRGNPDLRWESTEEKNFGLDFGFFNDKLFGSFDYFNRRTTDILITPPYIGTIGAGASQVQNGATVDNKGYEFTFGYRDNTQSGLAYSIGFNVGAFRDKVIYIPASVISGYPGNIEKTILGHSPQEMFGYVVQGLFQTSEEVLASATQAGKGIGRIRFKDLNGDGKIDPLDQTWLGNQLPKAEYGINIGLNYKGFDFMLFAQGIYGRKVNNGIKSQTDFLNTGMNNGTRLLNAWTPQNTSSTIPMLSNANSNNENRFSSYYVERGDYFKIRSAELGYTLPQKMAAKAHLTSLRVFVLGTNLFTIFNKSATDAYTAEDPSLPGSVYPQPRNVTFGLNITF